MEADSADVIRVPARRPGPRVRLLPVAAGAAVVAIIAVAVLVAGLTACRGPPRR